MSKMVYSKHTYNEDTLQNQGYIFHNVATPVDFP